MTWVRRLILPPAAALLLSGCVAGMVAGAVGMAADSGRGKPRNDEFMQAAARQACTAHAQQYGAVEVIGLKLLKDGEIVVSGSVSDSGGKNWFECSFVTEITGFALRRTPPES